ncbi:GNAT family N-acetyltransferase [Draconibacterium halophilum]|uniref:GNAT family N-acetyltransferase n=1 Tax=Draconibacterium halophilum TaxID=2706887 RepID=A0A6C0RI87_9BACT|nr:GNAT family protein [Draconibacterium halophilum]QIA09839.1 GNAT family N-acetyltransferase [Draconibacterium halophilum]
MEHIRVNHKIRLELINLSMADIVFQTIDHDREFLKKWLPFVNYTSKVADTKAFIESITRKDDKSDLVYTIWYNEEFAGLIGFKDTDWVNRKTELGYWLAEKMQGKGIVTACVEKLIRFAFQKQKMNRVQIKVAEKNLQSEKIPMKLGFVYEGTERQGEHHSKGYVNLRIYSKLKHETSE